MVPDAVTVTGPESKSLSKEGEQETSTVSLGAVVSSAALVYCGGNTPCRSSSRMARPQG